jgi:hypothetical protein
MQDENSIEKKHTQTISNQIVKMFSLFVSRWLDLMMLECFFPIISVQIIIRILIMIMILIEHRLKRNLKCLSENFILIIFLSIGKFRFVFLEWIQKVIGIFREMLRRNYNSRRYWIDIELRHLSDYDDNLCDHLKKQPADLLPLVRENEEVD